MMPGSRIAEVAGARATEIEERVPGYRIELVKTLIAAIQTQNEGLSDKGRRDRIGKVVEALGSKILAKGGGSG
jgi:hypothetical protein